MQPFLILSAINTTSGCWLAEYAPDMPNTAPQAGVKRVLLPLWVKTGIGGGLHKNLHARVAHPPNLIVDLQPVAAIGLEGCFDQ